MQILVQNRGLVQDLFAKRVLQKLGLTCVFAAATHCNTLQHTAAQCNTLQHTDRRHPVHFCYCNTRRHTATYCNTQRTGVPCVFATATLCNSLQHTATHCNTLQHTAARCSTLSFEFVTLSYGLCCRFVHVYCWVVNSSIQIEVLTRRYMYWGVDPFMCIVKLLTRPYRLRCWLFDMA